MLPQRPRALALAALLTFGLAACGQTTGTPGDDPGSGYLPPRSSSTAPADDSTAPADDSTSATTKDPVQTPIPAPGGDAGLPTGPVPDSVRDRPDVTEAIRAHAERMGVEPDAVTVEGFAEVTWSDGSIGCPKPGMMYTQALVPGYQLVLAVDGELASYHAAQKGPFSYCANPVPPSQASNPDT